MQCTSKEFLEYIQIGWLPWRRRHKLQNAATIAQSALFHIQQR
jgi:hypothetical protein